MHSGILYLKEKRRIHMQKYFDKTVPIREREFYILSVIGTLVNIIGLTISISTGASREGILVVGFGALSMLAATIYGYVTRRVEGMFNLMLIIINLFEFPMMFLLINGLDGGSSNYFYMGLLLTMILMETRGRFLFILLTLAVDVSVMVYDLSVRCAGMNGAEKTPYYERIIAYFVVGFFVVLISYVWDKEHQKQNDIIMELNAELRELSEKDPLTKSYNRRYLTGYLEQMREDSGRKFYVLMLDIDDFKTINDTYGHDFGDEVLLHLAETLKEQMGEQGIVARFGGEEFIAVMETDELTKIQFFAECVKEKLIEFSRERKNIEITFSGGIQGREEPFDMALLLKQVDNKLYKAKELGKNRIIC